MFVSSGSSLYGLKQAGVESGTRPLHSVLTSMGFCRIQSDHVGSTPWLSNMIIEAVHDCVCRRHRRLLAQMSALAY